MLLKRPIPSVHKPQAFTSRLMGAALGHLRPLTQFISHACCTFSALLGNVRSSNLANCSSVDLTVNQGKANIPREASFASLVLAADIWIHAQAHKRKIVQSLPRCYPCWAAIQLRKIAERTAVRDEAFQSLVVYQASQSDSRIAV